MQIDLTQFEENANHKLRIKISGDGARMTRVTSFVIMSFSFLDSDDVMSSKGMTIFGHKKHELPTGMTEKINYTVYLCVIISI